MTASDNAPRTMHLRSNLDMSQLLDRCLDRYLPCLGESQIHGDRIARLQIAPEAEQHQMIATWLHLDLAPGSDFEPGQRLHPHGATLMDRFMELDRSGRVCRR